MRKVMDLYCDGKKIYLYIDRNEQVSMLIIGRSRMGKTYFVSCQGANLIVQGYIVHLIDLGDKWSAADKERLLSVGAVIRRVEEEGIVLTFNSVKEACACGKVIANALGFCSAKAISVLKQVIRQLFSLYGHRFTLSNLAEYLEIWNYGSTEDKEWQQNILDRLDFGDEIPQITFCIDENNDFSTHSIIWDLSALDDTYAQLIAYLINFCLLCQQKRKFRNGDTARKIFVIIDEFQVLDCDRKSVIGTCLAEGQKYGMALILITQFLRGNFPDAVISQFKQGGFRFYFRLTEEEAADVSRRLAKSAEERRALYNRLANLPQGHCLMLGCHTLGESKIVYDSPRFVEVKEVTNNIKITIGGKPYEHKGNSNLEEVSVNYRRGSIVLPNRTKTPSPDRSRKPQCRFSAYQREQGAD